MTDIVLGTVYRRIRDTAFDIQIALVEHPVVGKRLWCVGCNISGPYEYFCQPAELISHIEAHHREATRNP